MRLLLCRTGSESRLLFYQRLQIELIDRIGLYKKDSAGKKYRLCRMPLSYDLMERSRNRFQN
ncbi:hypothetical protein MCHI_001476 [Candidatus Magnetoovum chiemensis]|nr:hypothetical protein MCHI_001476 [Candidatus Magnetoovum chiemensis]